jgi:hypothetical protein
MLPRSALLAALALLSALPLPAGEDVPDLAARKARLGQEVGELRALEAASAAGTVLLEEVVRSVPELLWLEQMSLRAGRVHVSGQAFNTNAVASFIETLDAVPAFDEPTLIDTAENPDGSSYSFTLAFRFSPLPPEEKGASVSGLRAEVAALEQERDEASRRLARREDVPRILDELRALARELDLGSSSFVEARAGSAKAARVDVDLAATFHGLAMLFDRIRALSALVTLDELTVRQELSERGTIAASFRLLIPLRAPAPP